MSYGAFAKQAARYREAEVLSASPAQLVVIVYEHLLINLRRARVQLADAEARSESHGVVPPCRLTNPNGGAILHQP